MNISKTQKLNLTGLLLALGIVLPMITAHAYGIPGTVLLPMHLPVFLCGLCCGPLYGCICGFILPFLNSILTGMPTLFPSAIVMTAELSTYGLISGVLYRKVRAQKRYLYPCLLTAMIAGRIAYGLTGYLIMFFHKDAGKISVITALITGIPGIIIQLILIPIMMIYLQRLLRPEAAFIRDAKIQIQNGQKTLIIFRNNTIIYSGTPRGIRHTIELYEKGILKDAFVLDKVIGKSAAMIYTLAGIKKCYACAISTPALEWLVKYHIDVTYDCLVDYIQNRSRDGMCPIENTVLDCQDDSQAYILLKNKLEELNK